MPLRTNRVRLASAILAVTVGACGGAPTPSSGGSTVDPTAGPTAKASVPATPEATLPPGVTLVARLDVRPSGILALGDVIWAEDHARTNQFVALDPDTGDAVATIPAERPCDLVAAYDRLWLVDLDAGSLLSVDPKTREVVDTIDGGFEMACGPQAAGGAIWFAANAGFARVDAKTGKFTITETGDATFPAAGVTPSGKSIWGVMYSSSELVKIDIATGKVELRIPPPGHGSEEMPALVAFDSLWVGNGLLSKVYRLDPEKGEVQAEIDTTKPSRLTATDDGVWLTSYVGGDVQRIDPATNQVVYSVHLGGSSTASRRGWARSGWSTRVPGSSSASTRPRRASWNETGRLALQHRAGDPADRIVENEAARAGPRPRWARPCFPLRGYLTRRTPLSSHVESYASSSGA